jgi:hypothetical protein
MAIRISDKHDKMVLNIISGGTLSAANKDTLLQNIKTWLDANVASFKQDSSGANDYNIHHVKQALSTVLARGK